MAEKSTGQWVGTVVGAVAAYFTWGASYVALGATVGGAVGAAVDPPKGPHLVGPRLSDLSTQTATYGANIPRIYGNIAVSGNVFWIENNALKEVSTTEGGGKGGGGGAETTTYAYFATFAVGLCEGPIVGVRRIWVGSKLFYDAGSADMKTIMASNAAADLFTLHLGDESQLPDDRMQATLGVANTPAYRGLAYLVFKDLALKDHGNTLLGAPIKVEVIASGGIVSRAMTATYTGLGTMMNVVWDTRQFIAMHQSANTANYVTSPDGQTWTTRSNPAAIGANVSVEIASKGKVTLAFWAYQTGIWRTEDGRSWKRVNAIAGDNYWGLASNGSKFLMFARELTAQVYLSKDGKIWKVAEDLPYPTSYAQKCCGANDEYFVMGRAGTRYITVINADTGRNDAYLWPFTLGPVRIAFMPTAGKWLMVNQSHEVGITADFVNWTTYTSAFSINDICVGDCLYALSSGTTQHGTYDGINWFAVATPNDHELRSMAYADGIGVLVGFYGPSYYMVLHSIGGTSADLGSILQAEVLASNLLTVGDIDVSSIAKPVRGYRVANVGAIRSAIEPLQAAFPFDVLQSGYKIKFKPRGGSSVATVEASELDARSGNEKPGISIVNAREMDSILPRRVALKYLDVEREYDIGEQYAERLNTDAINISALDMPLVMAAGEAAGNAEMLLYLYWLERYDISFSLPPSYSHLEPGDVITVNANEGTYSLRLTAINYLSDGRLECSAKYNSSAIYTPAALGEVGLSTGAGLTVKGDTRFALLDIPLLLDATDTPGFPAALSGYLSGWPGGILSRTDDAGQTWTTIQGFTAPGSVIGSASNAIGPGRTDLIDKASTLTVSLASGVLASVTEAQMLSGANHFAYGEHGRWEIIAAQNCTLQGDGSYVLTDMLRGRFGTEWAAALHDSADAVVFLDPSKVAFITSNLNSIGVSRTYRAVTAGASATGSSEEEFTYTGVNLECLAPVYLNGNRHSSTNDWSIEWIRRTRVGGEWRDFVDATLGETTESYEVEIYSDDSYATLKRTISGLSAPAASYTSAQQVTDFGVVQTEIFVKVYQLSTNVGRGYPLIGTIGLPGADPYWAQVVLALHMEGSNGGTTFTDLKGHAVTAGGNANTSTTNKQYGASSAYFDGVSDYLSIPASVDFVFGTGDFTVECYVNHVAASGGSVVNDKHIFGSFGLNPDMVFALDFSALKPILWDGTTQHTGSSGVPANTWAHVAWCRLSGVLYIFINGSPVYSGACAVDFNSQATIYIGSMQTDNTRHFSGFIDDMRVTKGAARYSAAFAPPAQFPDF